MNDTPAASADSARLAELGYESHFKREMSPWANFSLGFTYLSPVVSTYTLFGIALALGGPPMIWASSSPVSASSWSRWSSARSSRSTPSRAASTRGHAGCGARRWAWMTGWVYMLALLVTITSVAYGAGPYIAIDSRLHATVNTTVVCALAVIVVATLINYAGTKALC